MNGEWPFSCRCRDCNSLWFHGNNLLQYEKMGYRTVRHEQMELPDDVVFVWEVMEREICIRVKWIHKSENGNTKAKMGISKTQIT